MQKLLNVTQTKLPAKKKPNYSFLEVKPNICRCERLFSSLQLEASLLKHAQNAAFNCFHCVVLVAQDEVCLSKSFNLDVNDSAGSIASVHCFINLNYNQINKA